mmetsp:Transcript_414/g.971  ORF Transcript_414/g.971 Transcript_414/m.971 type:complete len:263 (+) Transcript_414:523-1311(+)
MLRGSTVSTIGPLGNSFSKHADLLVPWHIFHGKVRSIGLAAVGNSLDLDKVWLTKLNEFGVAFELLLHHVPLFHQCQSIHGTLALVTKCLETTCKAFPEVFEERAVHFTQSVLGCSIYTDIKLSYRLKVLDCVRELGIGDQKGGDLARMELIDKFINTRVHDGLTNEGEGTVANVEGLLKTLRLDSRNALHLFNHATVQIDGLANDVCRVILLPAPLATNGVLMMPPAEDTFVCTRQTRSGLHALVRGDTVKGVLVATTTST